MENDNGDAWIIDNVNVDEQCFAPTTNGERGQRPIPVSRRVATGASWQCPASIAGACAVRL
mgnify:CR=1 FL=1